MVRAHLRVRLFTGGFGTVMIRDPITVCRAQITIKTPSSQLGAISRRFIFTKSVITLKSRLKLTTSGKIGDGWAQKTEETENI
ncbi:hypothetical protein BJP34_11635 [Moorena producens PAL-8-15-08-1]|uniref:Uncharacterized protein n=1 Tax=Moorena producens PAL-8-15-08-1 TaxID=1458985 RepID=A0A1D8TQU7_9CYAN|nr:hypothetical protein BJP34_11635 [Moorena producens PAL-8-15-08-1]